MRSKRYRTWPFPVIKRVIGDQQRATRGLSASALLRLDELNKGYDLSPWSQLCTQHEFIAHLYVLDILDKTFTPKPLCQSALDIGSSNWWYLPALKAYQPVLWDGVELPAKQRGKQFDNWAAYAEYFCQAYLDAYYHNKCLTEVKRQYDLITWFLPYVALDPLLSAGLPEYCYDPAGLLRHAWNRLKPGGLLYIVNQGEAEAELQQKLFEFERIKAESIGELSSVFNPFRQRRYGWVIYKSKSHIS